MVLQRRGRENDDAEISDHADKGLGRAEILGSELSARSGRRGECRENSTRWSERRNFYAEIKREWTRTGKITLGLDRDLHCDVLRAVKLLNGVAHATLERAAYVYLQCRSAKEKRGRGVRSGE